MVGVGGPVHFVGRHEERALLEQLCADIEDSGRRVLLIEGRAGIGKSALVQWFISRRSDVPVLEASASSDEQHLHMGVVDQLWANFDRSADWPAAVSADPLETGALLVQRIGELTGQTRRCVLVLEDVQWCDRASLQALSFALRRLHHDPLLVVITSRRPPPEPVSRLAAMPSAHHLHLEELEVDDVGDLARVLGAGELSRRSAERLWEHTEGLPLYVEALCRELDARDLERTDRPLPAPRSFIVLIARRLAACSQDAVELISAVSVLGGGCELDRASRVAGVSDPLHALTEGKDRGLLDERPGELGHLVRIPHPVISSAVYQDLAPDRRARLHLRAAEGADEIEAFRHRAAAAAGPDEALAEELEAHAARLVDEMEIHAAADALLRASWLSACPRAREDRLTAAVDVLLADGDVPAAACFEGQIASLAESPRRSLILGQLCFMTGRHAEAAEHLRAAWNGCRPPGRSQPAQRPESTAADGPGEGHAVESRQPPIAARVALLGGQLALQHAEAAEAVSWADDALGLAGGDTLLRSMALQTKAIAKGMAGAGAEGLAGLGALTEHRRNLRSAEELELLLARGIVRFWIGDLIGADSDLSVITDGTTLWRPLRCRLSALACRAKVEYRLGRWEDSRAHSALGISLAEDSDHRWALSFLCSVATLVPAARGEWEAAERHARTAATAAEEGGGLAHDRAYAAHAAIQIAFARADPAGVVDAIESVLDLLHRDGFGEPGVMPWRELYADALIDTGRVDEAAAVVAEVEALAERKANPLALATARRIRGHLLAASADHASAVDAFDEAADHLAEVRAPFDQAQLADVHGRSLRRMGRRSDAAALLQRAADIYGELGAAPFLERAERELAACGRSLRQRRSPESITLTAQETATASLAARGRTNKEIAAELIISVKTVEYHLGNVFRKLGVSSRRELRDRVGTADP